MIRNIQRRWFEVWGTEEAQNRFLKYLLAIFCLVSVAELAAITALCSRKPVLVAVGAAQTQWNAAREPDPGILTQELSRVIIRYLKLRHCWEWTTIDARDREAAALVSPIFKEKFLIAVQEQIRTAEAKQVSQKLFPDEPKLDLKAKRATVSAERILIVGGLRASQPMSFELGFEFGERTETNPEGIYITSENAGAPNP